MLLTKAGVVIKIPKGSLQSDNSNVKLDVKEALSNEDIVLAGLTTMSGKQALSSGGMLYINAAAGYNVTIKKALEAMVPTKDYNPEMSVYKGVDSAGKIDWKEPEPLPEDSTLWFIKVGRELFKANCANCHKPTEDYTGPALADATKKYTRKWLHDFVHSPEEMIKTDKAAAAIARKYRPTLMTSFPMLESNAIDAILAYTSTSGRIAAGGNTAKSKDPCTDSCIRYWNALDAIQYERDNTIFQNGEFFNLDRAYPVDTTTKFLNTEPPVANTEEADPVETVIPERAMATFYTVNISSFGWTNIDCLLEKLSECTPSELYVNLNSDKKLHYTVLLVIPAVKAFVNGGKLANGTQYGFDETNGKVPLPQSAQCYVIAFAEIDGRLIFGKKAFIASEKQTIDIDFAETTKEGLQKAIKDLKLDGVDADVKDSKNAEKIRAIDKQSEAAEKLRPKNCNCVPMAQQKPAISTSADISNALGNDDFLSEEKADSSLEIGN